MVQALRIRAFGGSNPRESLRDEGALRLKTCLSICTLGNSSLKRILFEILLTYTWIGRIEI